MDDQEFDDFLQACLDELDRKESLLAQEHGLGSLARWWFDQTTQTVQFFDKQDNLVVEADAVTIGSYAPESTSWRWAWANDTVLPEMRARSERLRGLADTTGYSVFSQAHAFEVPGEEMAWEFVALSVHHLGAVGAYRMPSPNRPLYTYLALTGIRKR